MPAVGSILQATPATYVNPYNYALTGTTTAFTASTITLVGGSATNDAYVGYAVCFTNQANPEINRIITAYDATTKIATLDGANWGAYSPVVGTTIWGICNDWPVNRNYQWIKDGVDIADAIGGSFTPYAAGSYQVRETAFYPSTFPPSGGATTVTTSAAVTITGTRDTALVYADNLVWQGCFYAPNLYPSNELAYGGVVAYNAAGDSGLGSLFVSGKAEDGLIGEISIPTPGTTLGTVPTANLINTVTLVDPLEGQRTTSGIVSGGTITIAGLLVDGGKLLVTAQGNYAVDSSASWFWRRPLNLSTTGSVEGPFSVTDVAFRDNPRCYAGYMASVPSSLQTKIGGPVVAGLSAASVVSNTSDGPTYASFDPANFTSAAANVKRGTYVGAGANTMDLSSGTSMSATTDFYVGYWLTTASGSSSIRKVTAYNGTTKVATVDVNWQSTPTSGSWVLIPPISAKALSMYTDGQLQVSAYLEYPYIWDHTSSPIGGYAIPNGTRSVLCFSAGGNNMFTYSSPNQVRFGVKTYDEPGSGTGEHNYPYFPRCWAYDANELEQARLGTVTPGSVKPYAVWNFAMPILNSSGVKGAAYDSVNKRLFLTGNSGPFARTVVHVYTVSNATYP
jgi:hypothetical protein